LVPNRFLEVMRVFDGDFTCCRMGHPNGQPCDRERLMLPLLGIYDERGAWAQPSRDPRSPAPRPRTLPALEARRDELFPKTFEYVSQGPLGRMTETRPLFGDLVDAVQWFAEDPDRLTDGAAPRRRAFTPGTRAQRRATLSTDKMHLHLSPAMRSRTTRSVSMSIDGSLPLGITITPHSPY